jgi:hypothetical protein
MERPAEPDIVPPLVIGEHWDLSFFRSVADALSYLEPWYAYEDYVAFDSTGVESA